MECLVPCEGYVRKRGRWGAAREWRRRTAKVRFVRRYCLGEIARRAEKEGIRAAGAALNIAEEWHMAGRRPVTDGEGKEKEESKRVEANPKRKARRYEKERM